MKAIKNLIIATLLIMTSMMQATDFTLTFLNNTKNTVYIYVNYLKNKHKHNQGNSISIAPYKTGAVKFTDNLISVFASKSSKKVNNDGAFSASKNELAPGGDVYLANYFSSTGLKEKAFPQENTVTQASDGSLTIKSGIKNITNKTGQAVNLNYSLNDNNALRSSAYLAKNQSYTLNNGQTVDSICIANADICNSAYNQLNQTVSPDKSYNLTLASDNKSLVLSPIQVGQKT